MAIETITAATTSAGIEFSDGIRSLRTGAAKGTEPRGGALEAGEVCVGMGTAEATRGAAVVLV